MKKILLLSTVLMLVGSISTSSVNAMEQKTKVYICTGSSASAYHSSKTCRGLSSCKASIKEITLDEAKAMKRNPCKICCK